MTLIDRAFSLFQLSPYSDDWPIAADWLLDEGVDEITAAFIRGGESCGYGKQPVMRGNTSFADTDTQSVNIFNAPLSPRVSDSSSLTSFPARPLSEAFFQTRNDASDRANIAAVNDFVRVRMREDGHYRHILPPLQISDDELYRSVDTDRPVRIVGAMN